MLMTIAGLVAALVLQQTDTTVTVRPGMRLSLDKIEGNITVTTWSRNAVRVQTAGGDEDDEGVEVRVSDRTITVDPNGRNGPSEADVRITVPADISLNLSSQSGDVTVEGVKGEVSVESVEGNIKVRGGGGFISLHSVDGEIVLSGARGRMDLNTVDGNIDVSDAAGELHAETVDGEITLDGIDAPGVEATTVDGNIDYRGVLKEGGQYRFTSHDGNVSVTIPELNATISVSTFSGEFQSDFPVTLTGKTKDKRMTLTAGTGSARLEVESFDGWIHLRKAGGRKP